MMKPYAYVGMRKTGTFVKETGKINWKTGTPLGRKNYIAGPKKSLPALTVMNSITQVVVRFKKVLCSFKQGELESLFNR